MDAYSFSPDQDGRANATNQLANYRRTGLSRLWLRFTCAMRGHHLLFVANGCYECRCSRFASIGTNFIYPRNTAICMDLGRARDHMGLSWPGNHEYV